MPNLHFKILDIRVIIFNTAPEPLDFSTQDSRLTACVSTLFLPSLPTRGWQAWTSCFMGFAFIATKRLETPQRTRSDVTPEGSRGSNPGEHKQCGALLSQFRNYIRSRTTKRCVSRTQDCTSARFCVFCSSRHLSCQHASGPGFPPVRFTILGCDTLPARTHCGLRRDPSVLQTTCAQAKQGLKGFLSEAPCEASL